MKKCIISIGREFGSGGRRIGQLLAEELNIPCYDRKLIEEASECSGIEKEQLEKADEMTVNRLLYSIPGTANKYTGYGKPMTDTLFVIQSELIKKYAAQGSCVIIGRCADKVLEGNPDLLTVFIHASREARVSELMKRYDTDSVEAAYLMKQVDKARRHYYNYYSKKKWGDKSSYDLIIDSSHLSLNEAVNVILETVKARMEEKK